MSIIKNKDISGIIKTSAILGAIWLAVIVLATALFWANRRERAGFTSLNDVARTEDAVYISDNGAKSGLIWQLGADGSVYSMFSTDKLAYLSGFKAMEVSLSGSEPFAVFERTRDDNGRTVTEYAVVGFNTDMEPVYITAPFRFDLELLLTGFSCTEDTIYLTGVSENRNMVYVYSLRNADMLTLSTTKLSKDDVAEWEKLSVNPSKLIEEGVSEDRYIADAEYDGSVLQLRYDNERPDYFAYDETAAYFFNNIHPTLAQSRIIAGVTINAVIVIFVIGLAVIILLTILMRHRRRMVYLIFDMEVILFAVVAVLLIYHVSSNRSIIENDFKRFAADNTIGIFDGYSMLDLASGGIYENPDYNVISKRIRRMASDSAGGTVSNNSVPVIKSVLITDAEGGVILSDDGSNLGIASESYGDEVNTLIAESVQTGTIGTAKLRIDGRNIMLISTPLSRAGYNGYAGVVAADYETLGTYLVRDYRAAIITLLLAFFVASLVCIILINMQNHGIAALQDALGMLAKGEEEIEKPVVYGRDMNYIWNSIFEIQKNLKHANRSRFRTYEAYYRFAPKGMEKILGRSSITEVKDGDYVKKNGTIAFISTAEKVSMDSREVDSLNNVINMVGESRMKYDGIFVSGDNFLSSFRIVFTDDISDTADFGLDVTTKLRGDGVAQYTGTTLLLHYTEYMYGVIGSAEHTNVYLAAPYSDKMESFSKWFGTMKLGLILTETVVRHEETDANMRCIGFIIPDESKPDERLKLYEVIDAEPVWIQTKRKATNERFAEALDLFYKRDFYFSRNLFSEILQEAPEDEITKWYLFECERYLNDAAPESFTGALHSGDIG